MMITGVRGAHSDGRREEEDVYITISRSVECISMLLGPFLGPLSKEAGRLLPAGNYCAVRPSMSEC